MSKNVFQNFQEFFSLTRPLSSVQRTKLLNSLPHKERQQLLKALDDEGWEDLLIRNELDELLNTIKIDFDKDLVLIRIQVLSGQKVEIKKTFWTYVNDLFNPYSMFHKKYIFDGIKTIEQGDDSYVLISSDNRKNN